MSQAKLENMVGIKDQIVRIAWSSAIKAHNDSEKLFLVEKNRDLPIVVFSFSGSWSVNEWFSGGSSFGETEISKELFPSIRSIGVNEYAKVNNAFFQRFLGVLGKLKDEVYKLKDDQLVVFTGHSSGGPIAILATIWLLEEQRKLNTNLNPTPTPPTCVTFGSPLVGNFIFSHALRREKWCSHFIHFVMKYDIVPRIHLSPLPSLQLELQTILNSLKSKSSKSNMASTFFTTVVRNASTVVSNTTCRLIGNTNILLDTLTNFVELSPYKPFGTYIFCTETETETENLIVVTNPDAVLQLLFFSCQLNSESECAQVASKSLKDHWGYDYIMKQNLKPLHSIRLDELDKLPLSLAGRNTTVTKALTELGLSTRAILNLQAAGVYEEQKEKNHKAMEGKKEYIEERLTWMEEKYRRVSMVDGLGYYDAFKLQKNFKDFKANIKRLELAGVWDEIMEMLKRYELPDEFEGIGEWILLGTWFRRLVEPLDIANYYRHLKRRDAGAYMIKGRPKRYRFTQRWLEHGQKMIEFSEESSLWAEVEELRLQTRGGLYAENESRIMELEKKMERWMNEIEDDMLLKNSTFTEWWKTLPMHHRSKSCIKENIKSGEWEGSYQLHIV